MLDDKTLLEKAKKVIQNEEIEKQVFENKELKSAFSKAMESKQQANDDWLMFIYKLDEVNKKGLWRPLKGKRGECDGIIRE